MRRDFKVHCYACGFDYEEQNKYTPEVCGACGRRHTIDVWELVLPASHIDCVKNKKKSVKNKKRS